MRFVARFSVSDVMNAILITLVMNGKTEIIFLISVSLILSSAQNVELEYKKMEDAIICNVQVAIPIFAGSVYKHLINLINVMII